MLRNKTAINDLVRKKLKQIRLAQGVRLRQAARRSGIPVSSYAQMESGYYRIHMDSLFRMLGALELDINDVWPVDSVGVEAVDQAVYMQRIQAFRLNEICNWCDAEGACLFRLRHGASSVLLTQGMSDFLVDRIGYYLEEGLNYSSGLFLEKSYKGSRFILFIKAEAGDNVAMKMTNRYLVKWAVLFSDQESLSSTCRSMTRHNPHKYLRSERAQETLALNRSK